MDFLDRTLENFREYLKENTDSKNTVKNYVSDLRIFLIFLDSRHSPITTENFPLFLNNITLSEFENYLSVINPPATLNRRISSVKKFFDYFIEHHPLPPPSTAPPVTLSGITPPIQPVPETTTTPIPTPPPEEKPVPIVSQNSIDIPPVEKTPEPEINNNLLRLLPEEVTENVISEPYHSHPTSTPANFFTAYKIPLICILSFIVGFLATMGLYPIFYP